MQPSARRPRALRVAVAAPLGAVVALLGAVGGAPGGPRPASAHVVKLKDGTVLEGTVRSQDDTKVVVETTFHGTKEVARADVAAVDTSVPPLREQLRFRLDGAQDVPALVGVHDWAKGKGFKAELLDVWRRVVALEPQHARARKALGHVLVGKTWMSPEEKAAADAEAEAAAARAKGLVLHGGRWVTPQEKDALERGLVKDGDEWVTEEVFHARRGETRVDGAWVRRGEAEGKARAAALSKALGVSFVALWGPHVDVQSELAPEDGQAVLAATEAVADAFHRLLAAGPGDGLDGLRPEVCVPHKAPTYGRYVQLVAKEADAERFAPGWALGSAKARSFWWPDPPRVGAYLFPQTVPVVRSNLAHDLVLLLLNRYRFNYRFTTPWLAEGLAYHLEIARVGPSSSFTINRAGVPGGGDPTVWLESARWPELLRGLALGSLDTPMPRLATASADTFTICDLAKCWSVVRLLVESDPAKFKAFVDAVKANRDQPEEAALKAAYGLDYRGLEALWRGKVTAAGAPPPAPAAPGKKP